MIIQDPGPWVGSVPYLAAACRSVSSRSARHSQPPDRDVTPLPANVTAYVTANVTAYVTANVTAYVTP